jgi:hypothetical protein
MNTNSSILTILQKLDHNRRAIEYTLYDKDLKETIQKLEDLDKDRHLSRDETTRLHQERIAAHEAVKVEIFISSYL